MVSNLAKIASCPVVGRVVVPLVYVKGKTIMTLNSSNRMQFHQRGAIKNTYKAITGPLIDELDRFDTGHLHLILKVTFSDRRSRDMDNQIYVVKYVQDMMTEYEKIDDDKFISFTFLPYSNDPKLDEHKCEIEILDLVKGKYL